jgi:hypothetical protein
MDRAWSVAKECMKLNHRVPRGFSSAGRGTLYFLSDSLGNSMTAVTPILLRAGDQLPMVLLTLLSIVQALALEPWSHIVSNDYSTNGRDRLSAGCRSVPRRSACCSSG